MRIAIVGTGISGLGAAWLLGNAGHDVTVFEKRPRLGGHTHTVDVPVDRHGAPTGPATSTVDRAPGAADVLPIDTGFIVYNEPTYPNLTRLFAELDVPTEASDMSFAVRVEARDYEYAGSPAGLFRAQPRNLAKPGHWRLVRDILRFFRLGTALVDDPRTAGMTIGSFLRTTGLSDEFADYYLRPMAAAIWSTGMGPVDDFPLATLLTFFRNHGLLGVSTHHPWRTVTGGSASYLTRLVGAIGENRIHAGRPVTAITREPDAAVVTHTDTAGGDATTERFDGVVIASHADAALGMLTDPSVAEKELLGAWTYSDNHAFLHTDAKLLPRSPHARASWNYLLDAPGSTEPTVSLSYWMNLLQNLDGKVAGDLTTDYVVTLNPDRRPDGVLWEATYRHPVFDAASVATQRDLDGLNGVNRTWFCGAYQRYAFHEDGLWSAVRVARHLGSDWGQL